MSFSKRPGPRIRVRKRDDDRDDRHDRRDAPKKDYGRGGGYKGRPGFKSGFKKEENTPYQDEKPKAKAEAVAKAFGQLWEKLFSSPVHLDSALSKQAKNIKTILAQITPVILLRPASQAEAFGIGVPQGEPWKLEPKKIASWRPATLMAERMYEGMSSRIASAEPVEDDFPAAMISEWKAAWGETKTRELIRALASEAPLSLRASRRIGPAKLLKELKEVDAGLPVKADVSDFVPFGVRLAGYAPVLATDVYQEGLFEIQDEGSQLMALFALWPELFAAQLSSQPGSVKKVAPVDVPKTPPSWTVIDACAGAGGKTLAMADALGNRGLLYSYDTSEKKLQALRRRVGRGKFTNIKAVALKEGEEIAGLKRFAKTADRVLVDAPCSGWGVLRRNPDIKWRQSAEVLEKMPQIQKRLLSVYSSLVKPGGRLCFGVCTFRKAETTEVVAAFLKEHPEFEARQGGYLGPGPCDGFFMQSFVRMK